VRIVEFVRGKHKTHAYRTLEHLADSSLKYMKETGTTYIPRYAAGSIIEGVFLHRMSTEAAKDAIVEGQMEEVAPEGKYLAFCNWTQDRVNASDDVPYEMLLGACMVALDIDNREVMGRILEQKIKWAVKAREEMQDELRSLLKEQSEA
jgi:hypothetical protein